MFHPILYPIHSILYILVQMQYTIEHHNIPSQAMRVSIQCWCLWVNFLGDNDNGRRSSTKRAVRMFFFFGKERLLLSGDLSSFTR